MINGIYARVSAGETIAFRPKGESMAGLVDSGSLVEVAPCDGALLEVGDVVLARVSGNVYLHKVTAKDEPRKRVQISNNKGRINGWTGYEKVAGIAVSVNGAPRPGAEKKVRTI